MNSNQQSKFVHIGISEMIFDNVNAVKKYLKLDSYDAAVVVLRVAAASGKNGGISEAQLARELSFTRATMNRIIKRLTDTGHIVMVPRSSPRHYRYNFEFGNATYGDEAQRERALLANTIIDKNIAGLLTIIGDWKASQFENKK
jgi:predicted transcriptional regulator